MAKQSQSLAAQHGALAVPELKLPAAFNAPQEAIVPRFIPPYISFAHANKKDEWAKLAIEFPKVLDDGEMFLFEQAGITHLQVAKMGLFCYKQYWGLKKPSGELERVSFVEKPDPYDEHVEAVVLVYFEDRLVPANITCKTTKCPAMHVLSKALGKCTTPEWAEMSAEHRETLQVAQPFGRFYGLVTLGDTRVAKTSGLPYKPTRCEIKPSGLPEWRLLKAFFELPTSQKALEDAALRYENRMTELKSKA